MENESTIVCPVIDTIDWNTFEFYMQTGEPMIGGFDWRLTFQWHSVPEADRRRRTSRIDPIRWVQHRQGSRDGRHDGDATSQPCALSWQVSHHGRRPVCCEPILLRVPGNV